MARSTSGWASMARLVRSVWPGGGGVPPQRTDPLPSPPIYPLEKCAPFFHRGVLRPCYIHSKVHVVRGPWDSKNACYCTQQIRGDGTSNAVFLV